MALDEATRERLRAAAAKNKGRTNLMGLDQTLGLVALDNVQDRDGELLKWTLRADGHLRYAQSGTFSFDVSCYYEENAKRGKHRIDCPWVRISCAPDWLKEQFAARWGKRTILYGVRGVPTSAPVFPLAPVIEFFRFIWPDTQEAKARVVKYLKGHSQSWIDRNPGVGARVLIYDTHQERQGQVGTIIKATGYSLHYQFEDGGRIETNGTPHPIGTVVG